MKRSLCLSVSLLLALFATQAGAGPLGIDLNTDTPNTLGCTAKKATLRANKSETFDCLKFALGGAGERSDGHARTSVRAFACRA